eukprot:SAG11_NODE_9693_length_889_cov_1.488608_1_plen_96_part_10
MRETREATFGRLRKEWAAPPLELLDAALPAGWAGGGKPDLEAARSLLFAPTHEQMAHYPALIAAGDERRLQVPALTLLYLKHVREWGRLRAFAEQG